MKYYQKRKDNGYERLEMGQMATMNSKVPTKIEALRYKKEVGETIV